MLWGSRTWWPMITTGSCCRSSSWMICKPRGGSGRVFPLPSRLRHRLCRKVCAGWLDMRVEKCIGSEKSPGRAAGSRQGTTRPAGSGSRACRSTVGQTARRQTTGQRIETTAAPAPLTPPACACCGCLSEDGSTVSVFHPQSCVKFDTDSGKKVWARCGKMGGGLKGPKTAAVLASAGNRCSISA